MPSMAWIPRRSNFSSECSQLREGTAECNHTVAEIRAQLMEHKYVVSAALRCESVDSFYTSEQETFKERAPECFHLECMVAQSHF